MEGRVQELVGILHSTLTELVQIEGASNQSWREKTELINNVEHELEVKHLNGGQLAKVGKFIKDTRIERRIDKNNWLLSKAFNDNFGTQKILHSMDKAIRNMRTQEKAGKDLIIDTGIINSILAKPSKESDEVIKVVEVDVPIQSAVKEVAAAVETPVV